MNELKAVELLKIQRELLEIPRGTERFESYLKILTGGKNDLNLPIASFNPMSKEHVGVVLDQLVVYKAESLLAETVNTFNRDHPKLIWPFKVGLVVVDDVKGGWTCRETIELGRLTSISGEMKRNWLTVLWWCSDNVDIHTLRKSMTSQIFKLLYIHKNGPIKTLGDLVNLEAKAQKISSDQSETKDAPWMEKFFKFLSSSDTPTMISAFFGDPAAEKLGYTKLGFPKDAGIIFSRTLNTQDSQRNEIV